MFKRKRSFHSIGKEQYDFDFGMEKAIYSYLYGINGTLYKKVNQEVQFRFYDEWKQYIQSKYKTYDSKKLKEFRRYLCQDMRREKPLNEYWKICIPIILSGIVPNVFEVLIDFQSIKVEGNPVVVGCVLLFCLLVIMFPIIYVIYNLLVPLWDSNTKESLLTDYKEIIDEMIGEKLLEESIKKKEK